MSNSKPLPSFIFDVLYYFNRDQLERFSIVCRHLKNFIYRYFHSKPYRIFDGLDIRGGSYALVHNEIQWHPNRKVFCLFGACGKLKENISAGKRCYIEKSKQHWYHRIAYYSFDEMRPYLGPIVRIKETTICVAGDSIYNPEHIAEMESIAYLWHNGEISVRQVIGNRLAAKVFQPILNSPTIMQCRILKMDNAVFSFKDYKILYTQNIINICYSNEKINQRLVFQKDWAQFLEQPELKPVVVFRNLNQYCIENIFDQLFTAFSSAVSQNAFKIVFVQNAGPLFKFRETNSTSGEMFELKAGLPTEFSVEHQYDWMGKNGLYKYTLERSSI